MALYTDFRKVCDLGMRVYNGKMEAGNVDKGIMSDEEAIHALCSKVFPSDGSRPDPSLLNSFNNIVLKIADQVAEPNLQAMISYFANEETVPYDTLIFQYKKAHPLHVRFKWSGIGSDVKFSRVEAGAKDFMQISQVQTGVSYNPFTNREEDVENFRTLVNDIAHAKVELIYETIMNVLDKALNGAGAGTSPIGRVIPDAQIVNKTGATIQDFNRVANILARRTGTRPIFVADPVLIDYFAEKVLGQASVSSIIPDALKADFFNKTITNLRVADAVAMVNDFTTLSGLETQFPINRGYILGGAGNGKKPFTVVLAGGLTQIDAKDDVHGQIEVSFRQRLGIELLAGECIGLIEEDSITTL